MACHSRGESGGTLPSEAPMSSKLHSPDSVSEWRSREQLEPSPPSTSPAYWDTDEDDDSNSSCVTGIHSTPLLHFSWMTGLVCASCRAKVALIWKSLERGTLGFRICFLPKTT